MREGEGGKETSREEEQVCKIVKGGGECERKEKWKKRTERWSTCVRGNKTDRGKMRNGAHVWYQKRRKRDGGKRESGS